MKFCPYCGVVLSDGAARFCAECGRALQSNRPPHTDQKPQNPPRAQQPKRKIPPKPQQKRKPPQSQTPPQPKKAIVDADSYYRDVKPDDNGQLKDAIQPEIIKYVALVAAGVFIIIALAVLAMNFL